MIIRYYTEEEPLTLRELEGMPNGNVFAEGITTIDGEHDTEWVAVKGNKTDWAIYYSKDHTYQPKYETRLARINANCEKLTDLDIVIELVPVEMEALETYQL